MVFLSSAANNQFSIAFIKGYVFSINESLAYSLNVPKYARRCHLRRILILAWQNEAASLLAATDIDVNCDCPDDQTPSKLNDKKKTDFSPNHYLLWDSFRLSIVNCPTKIPFLSCISKRKQNKTNRWANNMWCGVGEDPCHLIIHYILAPSKQTKTIENCLNGRVYS